MNGKRVILASKSPRRVELMKMVGLTFEIVTKDVDETHPAGIDAHDVPMQLAIKKAKACAEGINPNDVVVGADTVVILHGKIYEKPKDREDAIAMLGDLSGQMHEVVTGVCLYSLGKELSFSETTKVFFNLLTKEEITFYIDNYKPFDKAGSYACQEWIGAVAISRFEGDYFNVVGLPINRVYKELKNF